MKNICFTGHRCVRITPELETRLEDTLRELIEKHGATDFYAGGALGWDTLCEKTVLRLREMYPIQLHLVLPCCEREQTAKWRSEQKAEFKRILSSADSVEYVSENYFDGCMKMRNQQLVDRSDVCVCFYDEKKRASGTGQTVCMAQQKNISVINLFK